MKHPINLLNLVWSISRLGILCGVLFLLATCSSPSEDPEGAKNLESQESLETSPPSEPDNKVVQAEKEAAPVTGYVANKYFDATEMQSLTKIKTEFEKGLMVGFKKRTLSYAYTQHALRVRLNFLNKEPSESLYPFNGQFRLSQVAEDVANLPFITDKCGFYDTVSEKAFNYFCLNLNENYFNYLSALEDSEGLIQQFSDSYQQHKTIVFPSREAMFLQSGTALDFSNWDHQLFYLLFNCWLAEEYQTATEMASKRKK